MNDGGVGLFICDCLYIHRRAIYPSMVSILKTLRVIIMTSWLSGTSKNSKTGMQASTYIS
jgi:hypothetical protein